DEGVDVEEHAPVAVGAVELQQVPVVEGPDPEGVVGPGGEVVAPYPHHGFDHVPGSAVDEKVSGIGKKLVPEVEHDRGPRVLPSPGGLDLLARANQLAGLTGVGGEALRVQELADGPSPVVDAGLVGTRGGREDRAVEFQKV